MNVAIAAGMCEWPTAANCAGRCGIGGKSWRWRPRMSWLRSKAARRAIQDFMVAPQVSEYLEHGGVSISGAGNTAKDSGSTHVKTLFGR